MAEVEKWRDDKVAEQEAMSLSEMPKLTVSSIKSKVMALIPRTFVVYLLHPQVQDLDGEVQLLIGKARMIRAERERAKRKAEEEKKKEEEKLKKEKKDKKKKKKEKESEEKENEEEKEKEEATTEAPGKYDLMKPFAFTPSLSYLSLLTNQSSAGLNSDQ